MGRGTLLIPFFLLREDPVVVVFVKQNSIVDRPAVDFAHPFSKCVAPCVCRCCRQRDETTTRNI